MNFYCPKPLYNRKNAIVAGVLITFRIFISFFQTRVILIFM